jgi:hypothetical protein
MSSSLKERTKIVKLVTYGYTVKVIVSSDIERSARKRGYLFLEGSYAQHSYTEGKPESVLFLPAVLDISLVAHESFHAVWRVMKFIGAKHEQEVMAYLLGHVVDEVYGLYTKKKKVKKIAKPLDTK